MRQAVNNLQSTHSGFSFVNPSNVYKVCDQPHPVQMQEIIKCCIEGNVDDALGRLNQVWKQGFAPVDIVTTIFKVTKNYEMPEFLKLEFIKVESSNSGNWLLSHARIRRFEFITSSKQADCESLQV
jgi:replication factor C subunit 2/4